MENLGGEKSLLILWQKVKVNHQKREENEGKIRSRGIEVAFDPRRMEERS